MEFSAHAPSASQTEWAGRCARDCFLTYRAGRSYGTDLKLTMMRSINSSRHFMLPRESLVFDP